MLFAHTGTLSALSRSAIHALTVAPINDTLSLKSSSNTNSNSEVFSVASKEMELDILTRGDARSRVRVQLLTVRAEVRPAENAVKAKIVEKTAFIFLSGFLKTRRNFWFDKFDQKNLGQFHQNIVKVS